MNRKRLKSISAIVIFACALMAEQCALAQFVIIGGDPDAGRNEPLQTVNGYCGNPSVNDGEDVSYVYDPNTHTLTISGTGAMISGLNRRPWSDYFKCITTIEIGSGVTSVGDFMFQECTGLASVTIPGSVTSIGDMAFSACMNLSSFTIQGASQLTFIGDGAFDNCMRLSSFPIPAGVTSIGEAAFASCVNLTEVEIPAGVTYIGEEAFSYCLQLSSIGIAQGNVNYLVEDGVLFNNDKTTLICYPAGKSGASYTVPAEVVVIAGGAFASCRNLTSITFEDNSQLTTIGMSAFIGNGFESINIPDKVTEIRDFAFAYSINMSSITFGDNSSLERIGYSAFSYSTITSIKIPASVTAIGDHAFEECGDLTAVYVLPTTPPSIEDSFVDINGSCHFYLHGAEYDNDNDWQNEVINTYGHTTVYSLALGSGITTTPSASFTAYGRSYYTANTSITINSEVPAGYQPGSFAGYTKNNVSLVGNTFDMPAQDVRIKAIWTPIEWEGTGAENDPYIIMYPSQLDLLATRVNSGTNYKDLYFKLGNDITYSSEGYGLIEDNYAAIGTFDFDIQTQSSVMKPFNGTFDGNGKTISGITIYTTMTPSSIVFPTVFGVVGPYGTVKNLNVRDNNYYTSMSVAGVAALSLGTIEGCSSILEVNIGDNANESSLIAGIVGQNSGVVRNCTGDLTVTYGNGATDCYSIGGICGINDSGLIEDCYGSLDISFGDNATSIDNIGGICGDNKEGSTVRNCITRSTTVTFGNSTSDIAELGAVVGDNNGTIANNYYSDCTIRGNSEDIGCEGSDITTNDGAVKATILLENKAVPATLANGEKVVFRREFKQGVSSTVCLPVAIDESLASAAGKFFTFAGVDMTDPDDWTVVMQEVAGNNMVDGDLEANTPYLFIPDADGPVLFIGEADGSSVTAGSATNGNWTFKGTYESIEWNAGNADLGKVYGFAAQKYEAPDNNGDSNPDYTVNPGKFVMAGAGASIAPYRSYLMYNPVLSAPSRDGSRPQLSLPGSMKVVLLGSDGVETAVGKINTATGEISIDSWYDMSGRKLQGAPAKGGMYIHGGKTIMINE